MAMSIYRVSPTVTDAELAHGAGKSSHSSAGRTASFSTGGG